MGTSAIDMARIDNIRTAVDYNDNNNEAQVGLILNLFQLLDYRQKIASQLLKRTNDTNKTELLNNTFDYVQVLIKKLLGLLDE